MNNILTKLPSFFFIEPLAEQPEKIVQTVKTANADRIKPPPTIKV